MKTLKYWILVSLLGLLSLPLHANVLVLVHGYLGSAHTWDNSGITQVLRQSGWHYHGVLVQSPQGVQLIPVEADESEKHFYSVELPSQAPVMVQAQFLNTMLAKVAEMNPSQRITIAGHSAGGVVARAALVTGSTAPVVSLISIASPHLGTMRAAQALDATDMPFPFCLVQNFLTNGRSSVVRQSRGLLIDLLPPQSGSFLYWLNAQKHPDIDYHSIVRTGPIGLGDQLVTLASQDMRNLPALASRSKTLLVATDHSLVPQDGQVIVNILEQ